MKLIKILLNIIKSDKAEYSIYITDRQHNIICCCTPKFLYYAISEEFKETIVIENSCDDINKIFTMMLNYNIYRF